MRSAERSARHSVRAVDNLIRTGLRLLPWPFLFASAAAAQDPVRPWLPWRTITTATHRLHFPAELEPFARDVAARVERMDSTIAAMVGSSAPKPIDVVIDDPYALPNGYAIPLRDRPITVWWATPADPRSDIGNFTTWGELLAIHELTHLAHMTRPSRNARERLLWTLLPSRLGPIARRAPRWAYEGYATLVEGRISGTGRPNNVWRPAILRQWAIEGRLPSYGQLNSLDGFYTGEFAYLNGSAFLEWLAQRDGDSTLVHVWRRLTARRVRSFDAAFAGVYGDAPALLYGRHVAELTRDAMAAKAALERAGLAEGELVQRLYWGTGDPAISPNGERVAIVLRERDRPSRVVVWKTAREPDDTAAARRRAEQLRRDPEDVPDRRVYPAPKRAERTLLSLNGRGYQMPRWFADNRRVLLTRWTARGDGSMSPALYIWDTETGSVWRATNAVGVLQGDPYPDGRSALAMQCHGGHCDVVRVDLDRGALTTLLEGNARTTYYRPRLSPDTMRIAASMIDERGRWRIVVSDAAGRAMRALGPDDGANRYDAQWLTNDTLVVVSERGGVPNLERISVADGGIRAITRVTGAAVAPEVNRQDGSVWFLSLHAQGFDVRRVTGAPADTAITIGAERFGWAGSRTARPQRLAESDAPATKRYSRPRHQRLFPGAFASADGVGALLSLYSGDIIGRATGVVTGAFGETGMWRGASARFTVRRSRVALESGAFAVWDGNGPSTDAPIVEGLLALAAAKRGDSWRLNGRLGGAGRLDSARRSVDRGFGFLESELFAQQVKGTRGLTETIRIYGSYGDSRGEFHRLLASMTVATAGRDMLPIQISATAGLQQGAPQPSERFAIGGDRSPLLDSALMRHRWSMPMLPAGVATGRALVAWRIAFPRALTPFYEGAAVAEDLEGLPRTWHRTVGIERRFTYGPVPIGFLPRVDLRGGAGLLLDPPFRRKARAFLEMRMEP
jgi:hypothetical protein